MPLVWIYQPLGATNRYCKSDMSVCITDDASNPVQALDQKLRLLQTEYSI
jgi:hypothetical protein